MDKYFKTSTVLVTLIPIHHDAARVHRKYDTASFVVSRRRKFTTFWENLYATNNVSNRSQIFKPCDYEFRVLDFADCVETLFLAVHS